MIAELLYIKMMKTDQCQMSGRQDDTYHQFPPGGVQSGGTIRLLMAFVILGVVVLTGCLPVQGTLLPTYTPSATAPTQTPTTTPVWFPPTPTPTETATPPPPEPTPELRPGIGDLILDDIFEQPEAWSLFPGSGRAAFGVNELTFTMITRRTYVSAERKQPFLEDFYLEISANPVLCRGADEYGLLLRQSAAGEAYRFSLSCSGQARLDRIGGGTAVSLVPWTYSPAIPPGGPSMSRLGVWMKNSELRFFVNDSFVFNVTDPMLTNGRFGLFARSAFDEPLTVNFSGLRVYQLIENPTP